MADEDYYNGIEGLSTQQKTAFELVQSYFKTLADFNDGEVSSTCTSSSVISNRLTLSGSSLMMLSASGQSVYNASIFGATTGAM
jgi:hypothetical protein